MANEIFYHPIIRRWVRNMYFERATISTEPTLKGKKDLDLYHSLYPTKRISRRPLKNFRDDLWLMMVEAEKKELIRVKFSLPWENDFDRDEILNKLRSLYLADPS